MWQDTGHGRQQKPDEIPFPCVGERWSLAIFGMPTGKDCPMNQFTALAACAALLAPSTTLTAIAANDAEQPIQPRNPIVQIDDLLSQAGAFFLASVDGDQPKLRPLGAHHVVDGQIWLGVGEFKNVYRQLVANPKCEVVALLPGGGTWLRWTGRASFAEGSEREHLEEIFLDAMPHLRTIYDKTPGKRMMCFTLSDARAELVSLMPPGEILLDETASTACDKTFSPPSALENPAVSDGGSFE